MKINNLKKVFNSQKLEINKKVIIEKEIIVKKEFNGFSFVTPSVVRLVLLESQQSVLKFLLDVFKLNMPLRISRLAVYVLVGLEKNRVK